MVIEPPVASTPTPGYAFARPAAVEKVIAPVSSNGLVAEDPRQR
jgi:hypothetical protein